MKKIIVLSLFFLILNSCSSTSVGGKVIRIKGSDTMYSLVSELAARFMIENPEIEINVEGGGSASGIRALIDGEIDICNASRPMKAEEISELARKYKRMGLSHLIAKDALILYVNTENPIDNLTVSQVREIFTCKIKNWSEVGGDFLPIVIYSRNWLSGSRLFFREYFLNGISLCEKILVESTTSSIIERVGQKTNAIGYGGFGFNDNIKQLKINGIKATEENIRSDIYPVTRYLRFYTLEEPGGSTKRFILWTFTDEAQEIIRKMGFVPIWFDEK